MATVKISDLPIISTINGNTAATIIPVVDISTDETARITVRTLADGLFHNDSLKVGPNEILLTNTVAQFSGNSQTFLQTNLQNLTGNGSADYVATADIGTNANNYIDLGINNSTYNDPEYSATKRLDGYLYVSGSLDNSSDGNLVIGTASAGANVSFVAGGTTTANVIAKITKFGITLNNSSRLEFTDGSIQTVAAAPASLSQLAANTANSASANTIIIQGVNAWQNTQITAVNQYAQSGFAKANDVNGYATSAYNTANGANGLAAGAYNAANGANGLAAGAFNKANNALANTFAITVNNSIYIPGTLVIDGLVYANGATYVANAMSIPTTYSSPQTAITLNYQQANIVKTNVTSDLVVSHTGIVLGKYIDLFVYNDSAAVRTITHGVPANNSTTKASTIKISPYSTKHLKYFTVNSDLANTYVIESISENTIESNLNVNGFITLNTAGGIYQETASPSVMTANTTGIFQIVTNRHASPYSWSFNQEGTFTVPGEGVIRSNDDTITLQSFDSVNGIARGIYIGTNGGVYFNKGSEPVYLSLTDDSALISNNNTAIVTAVSNVRIITDGINTARQFEFGSDGSLTIPNGLVVNNANTVVRDLNVNKNLTVNGIVVLANSNFSATEAAFRITASGSSQTPTQAGTLMQLTSKANTPARVLIDSFGASNTAYPIIAGRAARGTVDAPTATQNNDILLRIAGNSYGTTGYAPFGDARIDFIATENHSDTNRGSRIRFWNTPTGSNVVNEIASFNADSVYFTGIVAPQKGFIYAPTILAGAQTAFTIDFSTTSLIKATLAADCTISLSNYVPGKVVEVWLTNTGGPARTVTHGCTATNSTDNSTTFTMSGTSSAYLRYFSIDGDNANTFVAIQYA